MLCFQQLLKMLCQSVFQQYFLDVPAEEVPQAAMESVIAAVSKSAENFFIFFII